jgi:hypothetical protein
MQVFRHVTPRGFLRLTNVRQASNTTQELAYCIDVMHGIQFVEAQRDNDPHLAWREAAWPDACAPDASVTKIFVRRSTDPGPQSSR